MRALIVIISIVVVTATAGTIIVGLRSFDGLVTEKPYESGLAWDATNRNREKLGWSVRLPATGFKTGKNELVLVIRDKSGSALTNADVRLMLSRPSTGDYDRVYQTEQQRNGRYRAVIELPLQGGWDLHVDVRHADDRCRLTRTITVSKD